MAAQQKMVRVTLDEEEWRSLRIKAASEGISLSALVSRLAKAAA